MIRDDWAAQTKMPTDLQFGQLTDDIANSARGRRDQNNVTGLCITLLQAQERRGSGHSKNAKSVGDGQGAQFELERMQILARRYVMGFPAFLRKDEGTDRKLAILRPDDSDKR